MVGTTKIKENCWAKEIFLGNGNIVTYIYLDVSRLRNCDFI